MIKMEAKGREGVGKQAAKQLRREGQIPAVIYGLKRDPRTLMVESQLMAKVVLQAGGSSLIEVTIDGSDPEPVMITEVQRHGLSRKLLHVDFKRIDLKKTDIFSVALEAIGESTGVKDGGVLNLIADFIEVECLPTALPGSIQVDVTELDIGDALYARDLTMPEELVLKTEPNQMLVNIGAPAAEEEVVEEEVTEEEAEAAAAAAAEGEEPTEEGAEKKPEEETKT